MAESRRVKAGIVGCGDISLHGYFPFVSEIFDLTATCDIMEDRAKEMARIWGARAYYRDMDDMLENADIEAVFVLTSMSSHAALSLKAAQAGKHFLVQKPFATDLDEGLAVVDAAREAGVKGLAEPNYWLDPVYTKAKEIIDEGHIGTVHYILGRTERDFVPLWGGRNFYEYEGGGMLFDMGVYLVSALTYLVGPATKVTGVATVSVPERPPVYTDDVFTEFLKGYERGDNPNAYKRESGGTVPAVMDAPDNTFTMIEWPNNCLGCVVANSVSFVAPPPGGRYLVLCGEKGTIGFGLPGSDSRLSVATLDKESEYYVPSFRPGQMEGAGWYHFPANAFAPWRYTAGSTQHLHDCIVNDTEPVASIEWGLHVAEIMIKSFESAAQGQALELMTTF
jgi:predicted dehydrogenase